MNRYILLILFLTLYSCERKPTIIVNQSALDTMTAYAAGNISEWTKRDAFLREHGKTIESYFVSKGYGYRLAECKSAWKVFLDGDRVVIVGSVAKSHPEGFGFSWVGRINGSTLVPEFVQIGTKVEIGGTYPSGVLPY